MIKCVCGCDPELCACAYEPFFIQPPPDDADDYDDERDPSVWDDAHDEG